MHVRAVALLCAVSAALCWSCKDKDKVKAEPTASVDKAAGGTKAASADKTRPSLPAKGSANNTGEGSAPGRAGGQFAMADELRASGEKEGEFEIDRASVARFKTEPSLLANAAQVTPVREQGEMVGFRLAKLDPTSPLAQVGLRDGDVVTKVGSKELRDPKSLIEALQAASDIEQIAIEFKRGGDLHTITVTVVH